MSIRQLGPSDATEFITLRRRALEQEPHSFGASLEDDRALDPDYLARALANREQAVFGFFVPSLVGMAGVFRQREAKSRHKVTIWGVYVDPAARGHGVARSLMTAVLGWARAQPGVSHANLIVSTRTPAARKLYSSLGFVTWGIEPGALSVNGELVDDEHMVLKVRSEK